MWETGPLSSVVAPASGFTPCAGTTISVANPPSVANGWAYSNLDTTGGHTDPLGGTTATSMVVIGTQGSFSTNIDIALGATLTGGVTYAFTALLAPISGNTWIFTQITDGVANAFGVFFNLSDAGTVGSTTSAGTGSTSCAKITTSTNGYYLLSFAGAYSATNTLAHVAVYPVDGDGTGTATIGQTFYAYQVSP